MRAECLSLVEDDGRQRKPTAAVLVRDSIRTGSSSTGSLLAASWHLPSSLAPQQ